MNFYDMLGVNRDATKEEIKSAYKSLVKKYHPDVNKGVDIDIIKNLNEAKEILLDDVKRREYDLTLNILNDSKEFSKDKSETYTYRKQEHNTRYKDVYVTRWQFFISYLSNSVDNFLKKVIKSFLVVLIYLIFLIIKFSLYLFIYICFLMQEVIDFFAGLLVLVGVLSFFNISNSSQNGYVFIISAIFIYLIKLFILSGSVNIFRLLNSTYDKLLVWLLVKSF